MLALLPLAQVARVVRFEMIEVGSREFVLAARAKGLRRARLLTRHVLGLTIVLTSCVLAVNALSDIALATIDPRIREA